jgi:hypothetical protein
MTRVDVSGQPGPRLATKTFASCSARLDQLLAHVLEQAERLLVNEASAVHLLSGDNFGPILPLRGRRGADTEDRALRLRIGAAVSGLAARERRPVAIWDLSSALRDVVDPRLEIRVGRPRELAALHRVDGMLYRSLQPEPGAAALVDVATTSSRPTRRPA